MFYVLFEHVCEHFSVSVNAILFHNETNFSQLEVPTDALNGLGNVKLNIVNVLSL